ncbi:MAG: sulfatase [Planctomycetales bacterium]|nr:sulfatase [Planctomycetales bacterium]
MRRSVAFAFCLELIEMISIAVRSLVFVLCFAAGAGWTTAEDSRPNILVISIDDLNDWVGCLGGHPNARTPNIDRLAARGTLFANTHCQAPICTPSRASLVLGKYPSTTGLYFLQPGLAEYKLQSPGDMLVQHFAAAGYHTMGAGKFVHGSNEGRWFDEHGGNMGGFGPTPPEKLNHKEGHRLWDWGAYPADESETPDVKVADWVIERLGKRRDEPFFLVAGFWRPHVPMYAPPKYVEMFPIDQVALPDVLESDRDDLPDYAKDLTIGYPAPRHDWFVENRQWKIAVQSYLACIAFVDAQVGRVLDALDSSPNADDTIVVLLSDHGWHLGEKQRWAKRSLWEDGGRVPLIIAAPDHASGQVCKRPTGLIDLFPTLLELAGLPRKMDLEGRSLKVLMDSPDAPWDRPVLCTFTPNNHSLRSTDFHYIRYADGSEELYDMRTDPNEWHNLANNAESTDRIAGFRDSLPRENAAPIRSEWGLWEIEAWETAQRNAADRRNSEHGLTGGK